MGVHVKELRRGSFARGQAARPRGEGVPGRFSRGQEQAPLRGYRADRVVRRGPGPQPARRGAPRPLLHRPGAGRLTAVTHRT